MELEGDDDLTSADRIVAQEYYVLRYLKPRNFRLTGQPERRHPSTVPQPKAPRMPWPRAETWGNPTEAAIRRLSRKKMRAFSPRRLA